jgi:glycosyltransferase involved in cell wall biosynthesis
VTPPLSLCVIARDEADLLRRCLASVPWADERVVVVDARGSEATAAIAREAGAQVFVRPYEGNLEQKQFALDQTRHEWVLALDADEAASPTLAAEIHAVLNGGASGLDGFEVNRVTFHLGRWIRHGDFYPDWQLRLFRRSAARYVGVNPHGHVVVAGSVGRLGGDLEHRSYRDLADQVDRIQEFSRIQALALQESGKRARLRDLVLRPVARFLRAYLLKAGFRDGIPGFVIAAATAFHVLLKYAKLWELQHRDASRAEAEPQGQPRGTSRS